MKVTKRVRTVTIFSATASIDLARPPAEKQSAWYPNDQDSLDKASKRAASLIDAIRAAAKTHDLPVHFWLENAPSGGTQIVASGTVTSG